MVWPFEKRSLENPKVSLSSPQALELIFGVSESDAGVSVTAKNALSVPAFWQGVNFLAGTIASLPLHAYQTKDGAGERLNDDLEYTLNKAANNRTTSFMWRKKMMCDVFTHGRHCSFVQKTKAGKVTGFYPLDPTKLAIKLVNNDLTYTIDKKTYTSDEILDIPWMLEADGFTHVDPISKLKNSLGLSIALEKYGASFFKNGGIPPVVLQGPAMSPGAAKRAGDDLKSVISKAVKEGRVPAIPEGYEIKPVGIEPEKAQMHESRRFQIEEIARVLDLPPVFLHDLTKGTFNNTEQAALNLVKHTLRQWLVAIEQEINLKLFDAKSMKYVEFNVDGLLRGDFTTRMEGMSKGVQNGLLTPNEGRKMDNRPPVDGGDETYLQQNMMSLNGIGDANAPQED